jgi:hypothetical protein
MLLALKDAIGVIGVMIAEMVLILANTVIGIQSAKKERMKSNEFKRRK